MSVIDDQSVIEASLGGRIDLVEMKTFADELGELFEEWNGQPFYLVLDYSKAAAFDAQTCVVLNTIKEQALETGAAKIYSIPQEDTDLEDHVANRLQEVLEGKEEYLAQASQAKFVPLTAQTIARAA